VLLIMDSLTRVAHAGREIGLLLGEPGAARGYPPSALATITKLVERAGNSAASGGSITGLYGAGRWRRRTTRWSIPPARSLTGISCSAAIWRSAGNIRHRHCRLARRVMTDITRQGSPAPRPRLPRAGRRYEANRDLVLMGAYRAGASSSTAPSPCIRIWCSFWRAGRRQRGAARPVDRATGPVAEP
jgi:flagellum-specific ATP synthase